MGFWIVEANFSETNMGCRIGTNKRPFISGEWVLGTGVTGTGEHRGNSGTGAIGPWINGHHG